MTTDENEGKVMFVETVKIAYLRVPDYYLSYILALFGRFSNLPAPSLNYLKAEGLVIDEEKMGNPELITYLL